MSVFKGICPRACLSPKVEKGVVLVPRRTDNVNSDASCKIEHHRSRLFAAGNYRFIIRTLRCYFNVVQTDV